MGLIEQAARRLEELQRAGIQVPETPEIAEQQVRSVPREVVEQPVPAAEPRVTEVRSRPHVVRPRHSIDLDRLAKAGFVTPSAPRSRIAEEFRVLKRPLIANATPGQPGSVKNGNLIMVTSSVPAEGKTFTSINLAMSIATEVDRRVLLVDCDIPRPSIPSTLGLPAGRGLMDVLTGAAELLASEGMSRLVDELGQRYSDRIVIFDSPPTLAATESRVLASHMGQIVFVVHAEKTLRTEVLRALAALEDACPVKLLVLNAAKLPAQGAYGYGYGYGYGAPRE
jgi:Mrp family chromosome partitioning ATPase